MPTRAAHPCGEPGCVALVRKGQYCAEHFKAHSHDDKPRGRNHPERQRLYDRHWQRRRARQLAQHPWCADCLEQDIYMAAVDVHHEERHAGREVVFLRSPLRSLCKHHHGQRTAVGG